jgi:hypothetical protein
VHWVNCGALWALVDIWHMICGLPCGTPHHTAMLYRRHPNPAYCLDVLAETQKKISTVFLFTIQNDCAMMQSMARQSSNVDLLSIKETHHDDAF